ncbi:uncharacterized protein BT62DRAFT_936571 [Guyanagaster necrorhizus]|uniref:CBM1 domain-containing protein n=1 Tax=Guyanagaster necrorhizus TaxID=856835 RepID=A0A9P7VJP0_9AGAR|nr:uncharacterized protein BT62DRAFT_936571 [Guyanagaster necrorhizus MCA 3950]KAG7441939.1 hypothetical protein BT62DRAFT_936571 [Guyanagaster necrorhizus MCA 3950]
MFKIFALAALAAALPAFVKAQSAVYGQCGGIGWTGATTCVAGSTCTVLNAYYSQCLPGSAAPTTSTIAAPTATPTSTTATATATASKTCLAKRTAAASV